MARKKPPESEPPADESQKKKIVQGKHTVVYDAPIAVDVPEDEQDAELDFEIEPRERKKKTLKEEKLKLRERWAKRGIAPTGNLRISLFKFTNDDDPMSGPAADKAFCSKFTTTADAIDEGVHLEAAARFGPGRYWIIVYLNNSIADQWEFRVAGSAFGQPVTQQNGQQVFTDPNNPGVTIQMPANGQPVDPIKQMRESFRMMKEFREAMGLPDPQTQMQNFQPQLSPEQQLASTLLIDPDIKKKAVRSLLGSNEGEKDLLAMAIEHGPDLIRAAGEAIRSIILDIKGGNGNGQAPMVSTPHATNGQIQNSQGQLPEQQNPAMDQAYGGALESGQNQNQALTPEDDLFARVLNHCKRRTPVKIAAEEIITFANTVEDNPAAMVPGYGLVRQYPIGSSVWPYVELFVQTETETALAFVAQQSEAGKQIAEMPHAKEWCAALQAELKPAIQEGEQES